MLHNSVAICGAVVLLVYAWKVLIWVWFRRQKLEKCLRQQGLNGNSYRFLFGDAKELVLTTKKAKSKPISFSNDIAPRVMPFFHKAVQNYGMFDNKNSNFIHKEGRNMFLSFDYKLNPIWKYGNTWRWLRKHLSTYWNY